MKLAGGKNRLIYPRERIAFLLLPINSSLKITDGGEIW